MIDRTPDQAHGESQFISMADMMTGFLFIFIILLMFFVLQHRTATEQLTQSKEARTNILSEIRKRLESQGIIVEIDKDNGVVRLPEKLLFDTGKAEITDKGLEDVKKIAQVMAEVLPCYANHDQSRDFECRASAKGRLDAVLVEGHTDNVPISNDKFRDNWDLSSARAINTYHALRKASASALDGLSNDAGEGILGVSGYGESRPLNDNSDDKERSENRRIDLRFIMAAPEAPEAAERTADPLGGTTVPDKDMQE